MTIAEQPPFIINKDNFLRARFEGFELDESNTFAVAHVCLTSDFKGKLIRIASLSCADSEETMLRDSWKAFCDFVEKSAWDSDAVRTIDEQKSKYLGLLELVSNEELMKHYDIEVLQQYLDRDLAVAKRYNQLLEGEAQEHEGAIGVQFYVNENVAYNYYASLIKDKFQSLHNSEFYKFDFGSIQPSDLYGLTIKEMVEKYYKILTPTYVVESKLKQCAKQLKAVVGIGPDKPINRTKGRISFENKFNFPSSEWRPHTDRLAIILTALKAIKFQYRTSEIDQTISEIDAFLSRIGTFDSMEKGTFNFGELTFTSYKSKSLFTVSDELAWQIETFLQEFILSE